MSAACSQCFPLAHCFPSRAAGESRGLSDGRRAVPQSNSLQGSCGTWSRRVTLTLFPWLSAVWSSTAEARANSGPSECAFGMSFSPCHTLAIPEGAPPPSGRHVLHRLRFRLGRKPPATSPSPISSATALAIASAYSAMAYTTAATAISPATTPRSCHARQLFLTTMSIIVAASIPSHASAIWSSPISFLGTDCTSHMTLAGDEDCAANGRSWLGASSPSDRAVAELLLRASRALCKPWFKLSSHGTLCTHHMPPRPAHSAGFL